MRTRFPGVSSVRCVLSAVCPQCGVSSVRRAQRRRAQRHSLAIMRT